MRSGAAGGWAVLYRFRVHPQREAEFVELWNEARADLRRRHGTGGSRPHLGDDGIWCAYALWPSAAVWAVDTRAADGHALLAEDAHERVACVLERRQPVQLGEVRALLAAD